MEKLYRTRGSATVHQREIASEICNITNLPPQKAGKINVKR